MREIKFRIWDGKQMIYPFTEMDDGYVSGFYWFEENNIRTIKDSFPSKIMQFTGLLDKNGKEIWEGDIVSQNNTFVKRNYYLGRIVWNEVYVKFEIDLLKECGRAGIIPNKCEVIGNVWENIELLNPSQSE